MDFTTLVFSAFSEAKRPRSGSLAAEDAFYAAHSGDWMDFLARNRHLPYSVERELRQMTTTKGSAGLS